MNFGVNPNELTDEEYAKMFQEWVYVERVKTDMIEEAFRKVMNEVVQAVFN